jgi:hypothetical protein
MPNTWVMPSISSDLTTASPAVTFMTRSSS